MQSMTRDDAKEACRLLLAAGIPKEDIDSAAIVVANNIIQVMNRKLAEAIIQRFFSNWLAAQPDL
jgi:hypothetical protein